MCKHMAGGRLITSAQRAIAFPITDNLDTLYMQLEYVTPMADKKKRKKLIN